MLYHLSHEGSPTFKQGLAKPKAQLSHTLIFIHSEGRTSEPVKLLSRVRLLATPWTAAHQVPPSMGFSRQEYWSGLPLPSLTYQLLGTFYVSSDMNYTSVLSLILIAKVEGS